MLLIISSKKTQNMKCRKRKAQNSRARISDSRSEMFYELHRNFSFIMDFLKEKNAEQHSRDFLYWALELSRFCNSKFHISLRYRVQALTTKNLLMKAV